MISGMVQSNMGIIFLRSDPAGSVSNPAASAARGARSRIAADVIAGWSKRKHYALGPEK